MNTVLVAGAIITAVGTLVVWAILVARKRERQRTEALQAAAERMNFSYEAQGSVHDGLQHFHLFSQGHSKRCRNILRGRATDLEIIIFDYRYTIGSGKNSSTHHLTVVLFDSPNERIPSFSLRPEHVFHRIGQKFGYQDIDFDTHPAFSKKYLLRGKDEDRIREIFAPHVLDYFDSTKGNAVEAAEGQLIFCPAQTRVKPDELENLLQEAVRTYALFTT